jgi:hypothetical protein
MPKVPFYDKMKVSIAEPIHQANAIAVISLLVAMTALFLALGAYRHGN